MAYWHNVVGKPAHENCTITTRISMPLYSEIKRRAFKHQRTMSGQVWHMLEELLRRERPNPYEGVWEAHDVADTGTPPTRVKVCHHPDRHLAYVSRIRMMGDPMERPFQVQCIHCGATGNWHKTRQMAYQTFTMRGFKREAKEGTGARHQRLGEGAPL